MNRGLIYLLIVLVVLAGATPAAHAAIIQITTGWCSPAQYGLVNVVVCKGVDPRAMKRLNDELDQQKLSLTQKIAEANGWAQKYNELNAEFEKTKKELAAKGEDPTLVQRAQDLLHQGKLEEARNIYDKLIALDEGNVDRAARDYFNRAAIFALQFRMKDALSDYARAYQYQPHNTRYADDYAQALWSENDFLKAEEVLEKLLPQERALAAKNPTAYRADLANTLHHLGVVNDGNRRFSEAELAYKEAVGIRRELAAQDPAYHRPDLADSLSNLGNVYDEINRFPEAEKAFDEAISIRRELAAQNPAAYRADLAQTLISMGVFYSIMDRFGKAEATFKEAVGIYRELARQNPLAHQGDFAGALNNLGVLYGLTHRLTEAQATYNEALNILIELAKRDPDAYSFKLAKLLNNLGAVSEDMRDPDSAEMALKTAVRLWRHLTEENPVAYRGELQGSLSKLAHLYRALHRDSEAEAIEAEAKGGHR